VPPVQRADRADAPCASDELVHQRWARELRCVVSTAMMCFSRWIAATILEVHRSPWHRIYQPALTLRGAQLAR
jgi:hypothetical protein